MSLTNFFAKSDDDSKILESCSLSIVTEKAIEYASTHGLSYVSLKGDKIVKLDFKGNIIRTLGEVKKRQRIKTAMSYEMK
jgi:hypothetical protein